MATQAARPKTTEQALSGLRMRQRALVDAYMCALVPQARHRERLGDVREAGEQTIDLLLRALSERREIVADELEFTRPYLRRALLRGATASELVRSARLWQSVLVDELDRLAGPTGSALVAQLSRPLIDYVDELSSAVASAVEEIQEALRLTGREGRAALVEDLLAGRAIGAEGRLTTARACGLTETSPVIVVSARPLSPYADPAAAAVTAVALAHATCDALEPLFAVRGDEIVIVRATPDDPQRTAEALESAQQRLAQDGIVLAVGVSAVHDTLARVPSAYDEACMAREHVQASGGGLLAVAVLGALDYLFVRGGDDTAWSLVPATIRTFIEDDLAQAGLLLDTLGAYVQCSLNVKLAAEKLFVHTNTAHYRLAKIEELTGRDLRDLNDLQELVIAVQLARRRAGAAGNGARQPS